MRGVRKLLWSALALAVLTATAACRAPVAAMEPGASDPVDRSARADPSMQGAMAALDQYLAARVAGDYTTVYELLSVPSQQAYSQDFLLEFFARYESYRFESVGEPLAEADQPQWVRFPVHGVHWNLKGKPPLDMEVFHVTVHYAGGRWGVALATPLFGRAQSHANQGNLAGVTAVSDQMIAIDPWDARGHMSKAVAWLMGNEAESALDAVDTALSVAPDEFKPWVGNLAARVFFDHRYLEVAIPLYRQVLIWTEQYPNWYEDRFVADAQRQLAVAFLLVGNRAEAASSAVTAQLLTPFDPINHALVGSLLPS